MAPSNSPAAAGGNRCFVVVDATISRAVAAAERQTLDGECPTMTAREDLLAIVERLVHDQCTVPEFEHAFYDRYLEISEDELSETDHAFFGRAQELLDWTGAAPSAFERAWGWMNHAEYASWIRGAHRRYLAGESVEAPAQGTKTT